MAIPESFQNKFRLPQAAHCLNGQERVAVAGAILLADLGVRYTIVQSIPHPNFDPQRLWHEYVLIYALIGHKQILF